jgi:integrase
MRLTVKSIDGVKLPEGKKDYIVFDDDIPGFGLRLREGGSKTWIYQYRVGPKQRRIVLGPTKKLQLVAARQHAKELQSKITLGKDPAMEREEARHDAENTVGALAEKYLAARKSEWRAGSEVEIRRHLIKHAKPLHRSPIASVSQRDVAVLLDSIAGNATSNRVRSSLSALFAWVLRQGIRLPEGNVVSYTGTRQEKSRDRVLSDAELKAIWAACFDDHHGAIIKLLMLTGQRANEIAALRWDELHDDQIILPGERTKNGRAHVVPLSEPARAILATITKSDRRHVFGRDDTGYHGLTKGHVRLVRRIDGELPHWTPHDLRRTVTTGMAELGVQPHIIEAVLNHVSGHKSGVAGVYNRATYDMEKRDALNLWAEHLLAVVEGRKAVVVPLKRA